MSSDTSENNGKGGMSEAALFETISHETRIRILFMLKDHTKSFSELKHELGMSSSGNLQHHIGKLRFSDSCSRLTRYTHVPTALEPNKTPRDLCRLG